MTTRKLAGLVTALLLMVAMLPLVGLGQEGNPPETECTSEAWNGEYWKIQYNDGVFGGVESNVSAGAITLNSNGSWTNNHDNPVFRIVLKTGTPYPDVVHEPPVNPIDLTVQGLSHITFCFTEEQETTTTTEATTTTTEATTTTTEATTTTTEATTTTTEATTTTTAGETTTTTAGETTSTTTSTTIAPEVEEETTSTTEAEVEEETTSTTEDETEETLPFTGVGTDGIGLAALLALATGAGLIFLTRGSAESEI